VEFAAVAERFTGAPKVLPPSVDVARKISEFPGVVSSHKILTMRPWTLMDGSREIPALWDTLMAVGAPIPLGARAPNTSRAAATAAHLRMDLIRCTSDRIDQPL
jgi:hypothetical protein